MEQPEKSLTSRRVRISLFFFFYGFSFATWASRIPSIQQSLGLNESELGAVLLAMPVGSFITLPFSGFLVSKIGSRKVVIVASTLYGLLLTAIGFSNNVLLLTISLFLFGSCGNMMNIAINTQAIALETLYKKVIISSFHGMWSGAGLVAAFIGTYLMGRDIGVNIHFFVVGLLSLASFALCIPYLLTDNLEPHQKTPFFPKANKELLGLGLIAFCSMICQGAMFDWSGVYFKKVVTTNIAYIGFGYTAYMVAMTATRFITDWLTSHIGFKNIIALCGLFTTAGLLLAVLLPQLIPATIAMFLVGIGVSPVVPLIFSAAGKTHASSPAIAIAAVSTIGFIGLLIGPPIIGFIAGFTSLKVSFLVLSCFGLAILILTQILKPGERTS